MMTGIAKFDHRFKIIFFAAVFCLISADLFAEATQSKLIREAQMIEAGPPSKEEVVIVRPDIEYKAEGLDDPFTEPFLVEEDNQGQSSLSEGAQVPLTNVIIQGLIWGGRFPQAIINNKVVKVGDTVEGMRITAIDKEGITLFFNERQYHLSVSQSNTNP